MTITMKFEINDAKGKGWLDTFGSDMRLAEYIAAGVQTVIRSETLKDVEVKAVPVIAGSRTYDPLERIDPVYMLVEW